MASYKTAFGSFLKAEDLQGRAIRVTIESIGFQDIKSESGTERKLVAKFAGKDKGIVLNITNCESLAHIIGTDDFDEWPGHMVVLYPTTTKFGTKTVPCIRIRGNSAPKPTPPPPPVDEEVEVLDDSEIPF